MNRTARWVRGQALGKTWTEASLLALVVGAGYLIGSEAAFRFADATDLQAVFFIPSGITLAALLRTARSRWWVVLLVVAAVECGQDLRAGLTLGQSLGFVLANVAEPVVGASVISLLIPRPLDLSMLRDVRAFLLGGVVAGPAVGATIGSVVDRSLGGDDLVDTFWQWWLGDGLGVLLVAGPILALAASSDRRTFRSAGGFAFLVGAVATTAGVLTFSDLPLMFVVLTGVAVAGARFGVRAALLVSACSALTTVIVFAVGDGAVMVGVADATGLIVIKLKFLVFTTGGIVVAAEMHERDLLTFEQARLQVAAAEQDRFVARFQRLSLPPETVSGCCFSAEGRYFAASSGIGVGGDWYDVAELSDGRVYISVGDVVGHGPEAALTMSQLKVAMSILAREAERPADVLDQIDAVTDTLPSAFCSTVWIGYFDPATRVLTYASAGHPPGFMSSPAGVVRLDGPVAPPISVRPGAPKPESCVVVDEDASLLLYTDGLVERRTGSVDDGLDDIARVLEAARSDSVPLDLGDLQPLAGSTDDTVVLRVTFDSAALNRSPRA